MEVLLVTLGRRATRKHAAEQLFSYYGERIGHHARCRMENFGAEDRFFASLEHSARRSSPLLVLLDSRGKSWTTERFAEWLGVQRDGGVQQIVFAVGPANGWSQEARSRANLLLALGPMTLPHELAAVVLAEQVYRAFTIVEGHPYHLGHAGE